MGGGLYEPRDVVKVDGATGGATVLSDTTLQMLDLHHTTGGQQDRPPAHAKRLTP
jgi:hypothetical protein